MGWYYKVGFLYRFQDMANHHIKEVLGYVEFEFEFHHHKKQSNHRNRSNYPKDNQLEVEYMAWYYKVGFLYRFQDIAYHHLKQGLGYVEFEFEFLHHKKQSNHRNRSNYPRHN